VFVCFCSCVFVCGPQHHGLQLLTLHLQGGTVGRTHVEVGENC